jgi:nucleotide-binding universal stress UspA family protein
MLASILLPLADGPDRERAEEYAFWLAQKGGHIHALGVIDVKAFEIPVLGTADGFMPSVVSPPIEESQALLDDLAKLAKERLDRFGRACEARGLSVSTEIRTGIPGDVIVRESVAHDIVVMSRSGYAGVVKDGNWPVDPLVSSVIRGSIRPVLVVGGKFPSAGTIRRLVAAYDGSIHASRALSIVAELSAGYGVQCILVTVAPTDEAGVEVLSPAEAFLYHRGVTLSRKVVIGSKTSELLCDIVTTEGADILVMGAYGHSPIREMFFGCTTERILSHCEATVILQS